MRKFSASVNNNFISIIFFYSKKVTYKKIFNFLDQIHTTVFNVEHSLIEFYVLKVKMTGDI
jgi:hypothetical protein